jgi:hypothetical protein
VRAKPGDQGDGRGEGRKREDDGEDVDYKSDGYRGE